MEVSAFALYIARSVNPYNNSSLFVLAPSILRNGGIFLVIKVLYVLLFNWVTPNKLNRYERIPFILAFISLPPFSISWTIGVIKQYNGSKYNNNNELKVGSVLIKVSIIGYTTLLIVHWMLTAYLVPKIVNGGNSNKEKMTILASSVALLVIRMLYLIVILFGPPSPNTQVLSYVFCIVPELLNLLLLGITDLKQFYVKTLNINDAII
ncbi:9214_t:CDS:1 [Ambispora gerdemannii]|uniref:9214_t:CDS:1 n=1 Tax=Ambispora gerdemannii TaxID=144530 RepID=A0A9N9DB40_9GLOM|nr:9214_t:CDS:1 [Ambispora gerdemannii]